LIGPALDIPRAGVTALFRRLEACGQLVRLDPSVEPTTFRCATVSQDELVRLRSIKDVIRLRRVTRRRHTALAYRLRPGG